MLIPPTARVCPNCGAPISIADDASEITCAYCHAVLAVDQTARQAREASRAASRRVALLVAGIAGFVLLLTAGSMVMHFVLQQRIVGTVDNVQRRAFRESCRARCPGECRARDPLAKDINPCVDACLNRCDKD